ncbi:MAG: hypothetical protein ACE5J2_02320 [Nitrososphaerales archaeon]
MLRNRYIPSIFFVVMFLMLTVEKPSMQLEQEPQSIIPKGEKLLEIDGRWSSKTEWIDASETKIKDKELTAYLRTKHDGVFVYILFDFISDQGLEKSGDFAVACFDTKSNGGKAPLADDYCFYRVTRSGFIDGILQGNGMGWTVLQEAETWDPYDNKFDAAIAYSHMNDPYDSTNNHVNYEFRIPIATYGLDEMMGFYIYVNDAFNNKFIEWPTNAGGKQFKLIVKEVLPSPIEWGKVHLKLDKESDLSKPEVQLEEQKEADISVAMKHKKKVSLVAVKNNGDEGIFGIQMKMDDGKIRFVKARGWDRDRIDQSTVIVQTEDKPIKPGKSLIMIMIVDNRTSSYEWTALDSVGNLMAKGDVTPRS